MLEKHVVYQLHKVGKFDEILTKIDRRSGKEIEKETKFLKNRDAVMVKMYQAHGRFAVRGMRQIVAIGVIKSVKEEGSQWCQGHQVCCQEESDVFILECPFPELGFRQEVVTHLEQFEG
ncbi:hypothetical protein DVH24_037750 [Malus domestica]|uniref:GTP-eEF1A C-terminal domain-containing protein n=1 Tax=Malus domestica TaxID=3750 RepID=A0A498K4G4_MALDO|nr:hypothetical protein DVH24_037750 [Malus domestica]